jgi:hypothetical protein
MKNIFQIVLFTLVLMPFWATQAQKSQGIGTALPNVNALLELRSTAGSPQGLLLPRMSTADRNTLGTTLGTVTSLAGMVVYDHTLNQMFVWTTTGWAELTNSVANSTSQWISQPGGKIYTNSFVGIGGGLDVSLANGIQTSTQMDNPITGLLGNSGITSNYADDYYYRSFWGQKFDRHAHASSVLETDFTNGNSPDPGSVQFRYWNHNTSVWRTDLVIRNNGLVGIGTSSPNQQLSVIGNSSVTGTGYFGTIAGLVLNGATAGSVVTVDGTGKLGFGTIPVNSQWVTATGNIYYNGGSVGIGTATPGSALVVTTTTSNGGVLKLQNLNNLQGDNWWLGFTHGTTSNDNNDRARIGVNIAPGGLGRLMFTTGNGGTQQERMRIDENGNVGIGTTVIGQKLAVVGNSSVTGTGYFGTVAGLALNGAAAGSVVTVDGTGKLGFGATSAFTNQWISNGSDIYYNTSGNVGIGTLISNQKFSVVGNSSVTGIGYFGTIAGLALDGAAAGSVVTVDGTGKLGFGASSVFSSQWISNGSNIYFNLGDVGIGTTTPSNDLSFGPNPGSFRTIQVENDLASNSGTQLNIQAGGAKLGGTNIAGGNLILASGIATGNTGSNIIFQTATPSASGNSTNAPSSKMAILGNGNVGIGTTTPKNKLDVAGSVAIGTYAGVNTAPSNGLIVSGNVGIGTLIPNGKLDVNGSIVLNDGITNASNRPTVTNLTASAEIRGYSSIGGNADDGFLRLSAGGGTNSSEKSYIDLTGYSTVSDMYRNIVFGVDGKERMRISSGGNVSIGDRTNTGNGAVTVWLRNASGAARRSREIVITPSTPGTTNDNGFTVTNSVSNAVKITVIGVLVDDCPIGATCRVAISGIVSCFIDDYTITKRGNHVTTGGINGEATSVASPVAGTSIGIWLEDGKAGSATSDSFANVLLR